jgi:hypothetical protein
MSVACLPADRYPLDAEMEVCFSPPFVKRQASVWVRVRWLLFTLGLVYTFEDFTKMEQDIISKCTVYERAPDGKIRSESVRLLFDKPGWIFSISSSHSRYLRMRN